LRRKYQIGCPGKCDDRAPWRLLCSAAADDVVPGFCRWRDEYIVQSKILVVHRLTSASSRPAAAAAVDDDDDET